MLAAVDLEGVVVAACQSPEDLVPVRHAHPDAPILAVVPDEAAEIALLQAGADEVVRAGVSPELALARGRALAARQVPIRLVAGVIAVDLIVRAARCAGRPLPLGQSEFALLVALLRRAGEAVDYATLRRAICGFVPDARGNVLATQVSRLRTVLAPDAGIVADRGRGYRLVAELTAQR